MGIELVSGRLDFYTPVVVFDATGWALVRRCQGYTWTIVFKLEDANGNPIDPGNGVAAQLFISGQSSPVSLTPVDASGTYTVTVDSATTTAIPFQSDYAYTFLTRLVISATAGSDPLRIILIHVLDPRTTTLLSQTATTS